MARPGPREPISAHAQWMLGAEGPFAGQPGFSPRSQQIKLSTGIAEAITGREQCVAEAATGSGKSLAYCIPIALDASRTRRKSLIVTSGIPLTEQLINKDLPAVAKQVPINFALVKGRRNYLCQLEASEQTPMRFPVAQQPQVQAIREWAKTTKTGDRNELPVLIDDETWSRFTIEADECLQKECDYAETCHWLRAKEEALRADVVVTNQHVLAQDIALRERYGRTLSTIPRVENVVIDEVHELVNTVREALGCSLTTGRIGNIASGLREVAAEDNLNDPKLVERLVRYAQLGAAVRSMFGIAAQNIAVATNSLLLELWQIVCLSWDPTDRTRVSKAEAARGPANDKHLIRPDMLKTKPLRDALGHARTLIYQLLRLYINVAADRLRENGEFDDTTAEKLSEVPFLRKQLPSADRKPFMRWWKLYSRCKDYIEVLENAERCDDERVAYWVEYNDGCVSLEERWVDVAPMLRQHVFSPGRSIIAVSATISVANAFDYFVSQTGMTPSRKLLIGTCFDTAKRSMLVIPAGIPLPQEEGWFSRLEQIARRAIEVSDGGALILCTSNTVRDRLYEALKDRNRLWMRQGLGKPTRELVNDLRKDPRAVLIGSKSLWTGVDIRGRALRLLIIDKLPFPSMTDPLTQRIVELAPDSGFSAYQLPRMVQTLKQGVGRLLRDVADYGVVVVCDPRLETANYGRVAMSSLPKMRKGRTAEDIRTFFSEFENPARDQVGTR